MTTSEFVKLRLHFVFFIRFTCISSLSITCFNTCKLILKKNQTLPFWACKKHRREKRKIITLLLGNANDSHKHCRRTHLYSLPINLAMRQTPQNARALMEQATCGC